MPFLISTLCFSNAKKILRDGLHALDTGESLFDFHELTTVDSSTVAVLLAWQRAAQAKTISIQFLNAPTNLLNLAALYGVSELLTLADNKK